MHMPTIIIFGTSNSEETFPQVSYTQYKTMCYVILRSTYVTLLLRISQIQKLIAVGTSGTSKVLNDIKMRKF